MEDFSEGPPRPGEEHHSSKLDQFKPIIDKWLTEDKKAPRKQRHTARRVHKRLKDEVVGYDCSYRLVAIYVAEKKKELHPKKNEGYDKKTSMKKRLLERQRQVAQQAPPKEAKPKHQVQEL